MHRAAVDATSLLLAAGETVHMLPQNISEFWNVCTRPLQNNGLGLTPVQTEAEVTRLEALLTILLDNENIYPEWRRLVVKHSVSGVQVHDARIVAAMTAHGINQLVTFNEKDFRRYQGITVHTPDGIIANYSSNRANSESENPSKED
jgi:predicted nucleic acid-binding protein